MQEECLVCKSSLEYLAADILMKCEVCGKEENSKTKCKKGHYVCNECHTKGAYEIISICLKEESKKPIEILEKMMSASFCHMHGPEHHVMVGAALLTAYKNSGGEIDLPKALFEMFRRGRQIPGGTCGFWGACGAGISAGMYIAIITNSNPLAKKTWSLSNEMTSKTLASIGKNGGPRCCKRDSYLAVIEAVSFTYENLGIQMELDRIFCSRSKLNKQCSKEDCLFYIKEI